MTAVENQQNTQAYFDKFRLLLEAGETLSLPVLGSSMTPFLVHQRDEVWLRKPEKALKKGDIVLYQRRNGDYILHRICRIQDGSYTMIGDAHQVKEPGILPYQMVGVVIRVRRKGKILEPGSFWWSFFAQFWLWVIPLRKAFMKLYTLIPHLFRRSV